MMCDISSHKDYIKQCIKFIFFIEMFNINKVKYCTNIFIIIYNCMSYVF